MLQLPCRTVCTVAMHMCTDTLQIVGEVDTRGFEALLGKHKNKLSLQAPLDDHTAKDTERANRDSKHHCVKHRYHHHWSEGTHLRNLVVVEKLNPNYHN